MIDLSFVYGLFCYSINLGKERNQRKRKFCSVYVASFIGVHWLFSYLKSLWFFSLKKKNAKMITLGGAWLCGNFSFHWALAIYFH